MFNLYENFERYDDFKIPYSLKEENLHSFTTPSGYAECGRFCLLRSGARFIFNMPDLSSFNIKTSVGFLPPATGYFCYAEWNIDFGYCKSTRCAERLSIGYDNKKNVLKIAILSVKGIEHKEKAALLFEGADFRVNTDYPLSFKVEGGECVGSFAGYDFKFAVNEKSGKIGISSENTGSGIYFYSVSIESPEKCGKIIKKENYEILHYDGGSVPYSISISVIEYDGAYEISYKLSGGAYSKKTPDYKMSVWTVEYDIFTNPYIRFYTSGGDIKLYLKNGELTFSEQNEKIKSPEIVMGGASMPYCGSFYLDSFEPSCDFAFGYEAFRALGYELQEGKREYLYKDGRLLHSGDAPADGYLIRVRSPEDKKLTERIPKDIDLYEYALEHAKNNHYFFFDEDAKFEIVTAVRENSDFTTVKVTLLNAFFEKIREVKAESVPSDEFSKYGLYTSKHSLNLGKMAQGVYHLKVELCLSDEVIYSHTSAFEVLDESETSPRESSGIPFMYSGEATPANLEFNCPDPWIIKPDHNETHYIDCMLGVPEVIEKRRGWEIFKLYKLKTFMWIDHRTTPSDKNKLDYEKTIRLADYLKLAGPPCYALLPSIFKRDGVLDIYREFAGENPSLDLPQIGDDGVISEQDFKRLYETCGREWLYYLAEKNSENVIREHEEIKKINPNVKFMQYGPYTPYSSRLPGPNGPIGTISRMISPQMAERVMDGFWIFEDYPFITDQRTCVSAWCSANNLLHLPNVNFLIELFSSFDPVCPDGAVYYAYPPMGGVYVESYRTVTQVYEHLYTSAFRAGKFRYYENPAFQFMQVYSTNASQRINELLKGYGVYLKNKPVRPEKSAVFISEYDKNDDRLNLQYSMRGANNISQSAEAYLYKLIAGMGLPKGYLTDFEGLAELDGSLIDIAIAPSLRVADEKAKERLRRMSEGGTPIFAVSDVSGLEDLFGVERDERRLSVSCIETESDEEIISERDCVFNYRPTTAKVLAYAKQSSGERVPFIFKNGKNVLIGSDITAVGGVEFKEYPFGGDNVSRIVKKLLTELIGELSHPLITADNDCGVSLFVGEDGERRVLLTDYSPCLSKEEKRIFVNLNFDASDLVPLAHEDMKLKFNKIVKNGKMSAFTVALRPGECALFKIV
jgi:hypothetical protein